MINKIKNIAVNNLISIVFCVFFFLLMIFDLKNKLAELFIHSYKYYIFFAIVAIFIIIVIYIILKIIKKRDFQEHKLFAIIAVTLGIFFLALSPLFTGSDEHNHYYRIYEITEGKLISEIHNNGEKNIIGSKLPSSLYLTFSDGQKEYVNRNITIKYYDEKKMAKQKLNKNDKEYYGSVYVKEYNNTALYSPIQYIPEVIGFMIGKILNLGPFYIGYLGRMFNLLFYTSICTYFIKKIPKYKKTSLVILLSPTALYSATTLTADGFTIALIFGFVASIIYNIEKGKILSTKEKILYFILSILIASCKIVYLPMILLLLLLPNNNFKSKKNKILFIAICALASCTIGLLWIKTTNKYFDTYYVHSSLQKLNILKNPIWYAIVIYKTYMTNFSHYLFNIFGGNDLYHAQLKVYNIVSILYLILFFITYITEKQKEPKKKIKLNEKFFIAVIIIIIAVLISTAIYVQCTANSIRINNSTIVGIQGRYFLPLIAILLFFDKSKSITLMLKSSSIIKSILLINWFILLQMFVQFIV